MCSSIAGWMLPGAGACGPAGAARRRLSRSLPPSSSSRRDLQSTARDRWATWGRARRFRDGAHVVEGIGRFDENRHFLELVGDGALDAAAAGDDGEGPVLLFGEERRLNESDGIAVGLEGCVGQAIGGDLPRVPLVGVGKGLGIDDAQFDCLFHCLCSCCFRFGGSLRNREPGKRGRGTGAKAAQSAGNRSGPAKRPAESALCGGRAAVPVGPFRFLISDSCSAQQTASRRPGEDQPNRSGISAVTAPRRSARSEP